nr:zf-CCHC domain-containing protein/UBN2 domain-containing protein [Tanacetum cinerariifolium]
HGVSSLALDNLIGNLKVHEVVMEKDSEIYKGKKEQIKSISLKAKKESSDDETSTFETLLLLIRYRHSLKFFKKSSFPFKQGQPREEKKSFRKRDKKKERVTENVLDAVNQIISLGLSKTISQQRSKALYWRFLER